MPIPASVQDSNKQRPELPPSAPLEDRTVPKAQDKVENEYFYGREPDLIDQLNFANGKGLEGTGVDAKAEAESMMNDVYHGITDEYQKRIEEAIANGEMEYDGKIPLKDLAVFNAYRNKQIAITDENAASVKAALTSVATNGTVQDDYDGSVFMSMQKMTDDAKHEVKEGLEIGYAGISEYNALTVNAPRKSLSVRKWSEKATFDAYDKFYDAQEAGLVGMQMAVNAEMQRKMAGLKEGEDFFSLPHSEQMKIVRNLIPFYKDSSQVKTDIDFALKSWDAKYVDCKNTEAGVYIAEQILKNGRADIVAQSEEVEAFLKSGRPRTEEELAEWLATYKPEAKKYSEKDLYRGVQFDFDVDTIKGEQDADGKWHLKYRTCGRFDKEFYLKNKVVSDLIDTDGRYTALNIANTLNEHPVAWSFFARWTNNMNMGASNNASRQFYDAKDKDGVRNTDFIGDTYGAFDMMADYILPNNLTDEERKKRQEDVVAALQAMSLVDRRKGWYYSGTNPVGKTSAGLVNVVDSVAVGTAESIGQWTLRWFGDATDYAARYASKFTSDDKAKAELTAKSLMKSLVQLESPQYYSDNTLIGAAAELYAHLKALGGIMSVGKSFVGGGIWGIGKVAGLTSRLSKLPKLAKLSGAQKVASAARKTSEALQPVGKWLAVEQGKLSPTQKLFVDEMQTYVKTLAEVDTKALGANGLVKLTETIKKLDAYTAKMFSDPTVGATFAEKLAQFLSNIPAGVYFYDETKGATVGTYVINGKDLSVEALEDYEKFSTAHGIIEALLMMGMVDWLKGNKALAFPKIKNLRSTARALDAELESIVNGTIILGSRDASKALARKAIIVNAFARANKEFAHNAKFMFTLEEGSTIAENFKQIADEKRNDPGYVPTLYDYIGRGQSEALAETAKIASTMAITSLVGATAKGVVHGGLSKAAVAQIADSRGRLLQKRLVDEGFNGKKLVTDFVLNYCDADAKTRKQIRKELRSLYSEDTARLFDQLAYEIERPRSGLNSRIRTNVRRMRTQKMTVDGIRTSLEQIGQNAKCEMIPDGSLIVTVPQGTEFGGAKLDTDKKFVVKVSDQMKEIHTRTDEKGKKVYDLNWLDEVISKALAGEDLGDFSKALNSFLARQVNDTQRAKKIARLKAGENIEGLLDLADKCTTDAGIYIPKGDARFGKFMQGENANLVDGIILLANANMAGRTPLAGTKSIVGKATAEGINVETFLHEYFHAITDVLSFTPEQRQILQEAFGTYVDAEGNTRQQNWQEGFVDAFLKAHFDTDATTRAVAFQRLNDRGLLGMVQDAARSFGEMFGLDVKDRFYEEGDVDAQLKKDKLHAETLEDFIGDVTGVVNDVVDAKKKAEKEQEDIDSTRNEICGGAFSVASKNETKNILAGFRSDIREKSGFGKNPKHNKWVQNIAKAWMNGSADLSRYPDWAFSGFGKNDEMLAQSLCVASLNSVNDAQTPTGFTSLTSLRMRTGISNEEMMQIIPKNAKKHMGMKGFDAADCLSFGGGAGYLKMSPALMETFRNAARGEQEKNMTAWAKENDCYFSNTESLSKELGLNLKPLGSGAESVAFVDVKEGKVYKHMTATPENAAGDLSTLLDRVVLFNNLFPEAQIKVVGWGKEKHPENFYDPNSEQVEKFGVFVEQPYLVGAQDVKEAEVDALMKEKGFHPVYDIDRGVNMFVSEDGNVVVRDINGGGVVRYPDGKIGVIDAICSLNTKQNVRDDVVPSADMVEGKFKEGTWNAVWSVKSEDETYSILDRIEEERRKIGATDEPETGKPFIAIGYHGTNKGGFEIFDVRKSDDGLSIFMAEDKRVAATYTSFRGLPVEDLPEISPTPYTKAAIGIYNLAMRFDNPLVVDAKGHSWNNIPVKVTESAVVYSHMEPERSKSEAVEEAIALIRRLKYAFEKTPDAFPKEHRPIINKLNVADTSDSNILKQLDFIRAEYSPLISKGSGKYIKELQRDIERTHYYKPSYYTINITRLVSKSTRELIYDAHMKGYDGVIIKNIEDTADGTRLPTTIFIHTDSKKVKIIDEHTYDNNGDIIPLNERLNWNKNNASWNIIGERALNDILGHKDAAELAKGMREEFRKAFVALSTDESRDARKRIENDEINAWLASRAKEDKNDFTVDFDGTPVKFRFYQGGADKKIRLEYGGQSAVIPRNFKAKINENVETGKLYNGLKVGDFYKKDTVLNQATLRGVQDALVFVKGTPAYESYKAMRDKGERERLKLQKNDKLTNKMSRARSVDPMFINGVGVNEYGDVVLEKLGDNRTVAKQINQAVVKLMQYFEGWETPVTESKEYFADVLVKRDFNEGGINFIMGDSKLNGFVEDILRSYIEKDLKKGRAIAGLDTDIDIYVERMRDAVCSVINDCAKYFNAEIEARLLGERFGENIDSLPEYSDIQKEVIEGLVKPYNHNGLTSQRNSKAVVKFYRDVVLQMASKALFAKRADGRAHYNAYEKYKEFSKEFMFKVRNYIRETLREYIESMDVIDEAQTTRENVYLANEYGQGSGRGANAEKIAAVKDTTAEQVEKRLDKATVYEASAMKLAEDFIKENGVEKLMGADGKKLIEQMKTAVREAIGEGAKYYADVEITSICKSAMLKAASNAMATYRVTGAHDYDILTGSESAALKQERRKLKAENRYLKARVKNANASRIRAMRVRNAAGMSIEEINDYFGRDTIGDLKTVGLDPKAPILDDKKFTDDMTEHFVETYRNKYEDFRNMSPDEFFHNPIAAAEYTATVAEWLKWAAKKCAYGRVRSSVERNVSRLRWLVRPSFFTARAVLQDSVRDMVTLRQQMQTDKIIENIKKVIDKKALGNKAVVQNKEIYKRDVDPLVQTYWKQVKDCIEMTQEEVNAELEAIQNKWKFGETEWNEIQGKGSDGLKELTEDQVRERRTALIRATALKRYGALKYKSLGELGDKIDEISGDIATHRERFAEIFSARIERDKQDVNTLVEELSKSRGDTTGKGSISISKARSYWRAALYYNTPDLFLKLKMFFKKGSPAYELCEDFRREMSLAHIKQEQMITEMNNSFVKAVEEIYGKPFEKVIDELLMPDIKYSKYARSDWGFPEKGGIRIPTDAAKQGGALVAQPGADANATRSANGLSKAQLMYIYAACGQEDMKLNNEIYSRNGQYFKEIADIIGEEGLALIKWMRNQLEEHRKLMSPICESITGMPITSPTMNYFPLKFEQKKSDPMDKRTRFSPNIFPSFLVERTDHARARLEERIDIFNIFHERMNDCAHYASFMPIIDRVRTTFSDTKVQTAFAKTIGNEAYREMYTQLASALNGGRSDRIHWLRDLRNFTTASTLFYNIPSAIKQIEGVGGWSVEMGVLHWFKNLLAFNLGSRVARDHAADVEEVLLTRANEGFSDVARLLKESIDEIEGGRGKLHSIYNKYKKHGLKLTELIDRLAARSMAGAYFNQQVAYYRSRGDSMETARRKALADVDYCIQTTQQSSRPEFQIAAQRGDMPFGEVAKTLSQFAGPAYVRLGMELEALHRYIMTRGDGTATKAQIADARKAFINKIVALHVICPTILTALELLGKAITHNDDDQKFVKECVESWARNCLAGPFAGMFVFGALIENAAGALFGQSRTGKSMNLPMFSRMQSMYYKTKNIFNDLKDACMGDLDADSLLRYTLDWIEALTPAVRHGENAIRNIPELLGK